MAAPSFATAEELRVFIGGEQISTPRAQTLVDYASAIVRRFTDQTLSRVLGDVQTFPPKGDVLILDEYPVTAITQILVGGVAFTDFIFSSAGNVRKTLGGTWSEGAEVTYNHGYETTSDEFASIKSITLELAARAFTMNKAATFDEFTRTVSEASGFAPDLSLTVSETKLLGDFGKSLVG